MSSARTIATAVTLMLTLTLLVPMMCSTSSEADDLLAQPDDISVSPSVTSISIDAGSSATIYLDIRNKMSYSAADPNTLVVYVYFDNTRDVQVSFPNGNRTEVDGQEIGCCQVMITVDKYASSDNHSLSFKIMINDPDRGNPIRADASDLVRVNIHSDYSAGDNYNKIMGVWENPLPAPLNGPAATTIFSFILWIIIAAVVAYIIVPLIYEGAVKAKKGVDVLETDLGKFEDRFRKGGDGNE